MVTFVQLLQHKTSTKSTLLSSDDKSDSSIIKENKPMKVHVLRLIELTQRMSAVMKFNEISETILHDPIMNMFSVLSQISSMKVNAKLAVAAPKDFCQEITENIQDYDINLVIIPWDGAGEIVDTPIENEDNTLREKKHTSPQRGRVCFGSTDNTYTLSNSMGYLNVFMPFFGGADDHEALTFVFRLLEYPNVNITVFRIIKSEQPTENDVTLKPSGILNVDEKESSSLNRRISTITISEATAHQENEEDESFLEKYLKSKSGYPARNARISYQEISSYTPIQTAVEYAKKVVSRKDLVIVGRNRHS
ncbi:2888_t:CDS:2 [Dentiscutata erythropus]|uniref:2888_t:CDS:1 n=1 Tax=Dentiscutata erythropus TaxID=1348616 RepID=A0A9N9IK46_9GLOM|nr:2888_t:CDS:2 [Dentiscutata erythropus]